MALAAAEQRATHLRLGIFQGEIEMSGGWARQIGKLTLHPQQREAAFESNALASRLRRETEKDIPVRSRESGN